MIDVYWPYSVDCTLATWNTVENHQPIKLAGVFHFYEHLLFRQLKRALAASKGRADASIANARTQTDHLYLHVSTQKTTDAVDVMSRALEDPQFSLTPSDFEEERSVVINEIGERNQVTERLLIELQTRYLGVPFERAGLLGRPENLAELRWQECTDELREFALARTFVRCSNTFDQVPQSLVAETELRNHGEKLNLHYDVISIPIGKRHAVVCVLKLLRPSLRDLIRVQILEQILRHLPVAHSINSLIREKYQASYGFHGTQVSNGDTQIVAWVAMTNEPPPDALLNDLRACFERSSVLFEEHGASALARLRLEHSLYSHAQSDLHLLPAAHTRFGQRASHFLSDRKALLERWMPFETCLEAL